MGSTTGISGQQELEHLAPPSPSNLPPADLGKYAHRVHSQWGEDGILEEVFRRLGIDQGYFIEFGAWDGKYLSNAYHLLEQGWRGLFIEGDPRRFDILKRNLGHSNVTLVNRYVAIEGPNSLDRIVGDVGAPQDIDLLSIDIDSDDLAIFRSLSRIRAKCVVIEFNPTIPFDTEYVNKPGRQIGNSALSIKRHADTAGYTLVAMTQTNLILVDRRLAERAAMAAIELERRADLNMQRYFFGYDGTLICLDRSLGSDEPEVFTVPWQHYQIRQPIPRPFRVFSPGRIGSATQFGVSVLALMLTRPRAFAGAFHHLVNTVTRRPRRSPSASAWS